MCNDVSGSQHCQRLRDNNRDVCRNDYGDMRRNCALTCGFCHVGESDSCNQGYRSVDGVCTGARMRGKSANAIVCHCRVCTNLL